MVTVNQAGDAGQNRKGQIMARYEQVVMAKEQLNKARQFIREYDSDAFAKNIRVAARTALERIDDANDAAWELVRVLGSDLLTATTEG